MSNGHTDPSASSKKPADETMSVSVKDGLATEFWLELKPYGGDHRRSLWLLVKDVWCSFDDPPPEVEASVQSAFCQCFNYLEVAVWYQEVDTRKEIVGLVVRSRHRT